MQEPDLSFYNSVTYKLALSVSMAVFFFLFLMFFLPFGVDNHNPRHQYTGEFIWAIVLHMLATLIVSLLNELILRRWVFTRVSSGRVVSWSIWTLILLGLANFFLYNIQGNWHDFHVSSALSFILNCSTVLIFPLTGTFFFFRYRLLRRKFYMELNNKESRIDPEQLIHFAGQGVHDHITLPLSDFMYARAQDNYVELHYLLNEKPGKMLIRTSLSRLADAIDNTAIVRCHRSYIVNLYHVRSITSDSAGYKLRMNHTDSPLPVSRSYQEDALASLKEVKNVV
jgi:hypothetical protein